MPDIEVELTGSPAVNVAARPVPVDLSSSTPTVALTVDTAAVELDVNVVATSSAGVADEAWTEIDITDDWTDVFTGEPFSFGTNGECWMRYVRVGRSIQASIIGWADTDHSTVSAGIGIGMRPCLLTLPYAGYNGLPGTYLTGHFSGFTYTSYFAYASREETSLFAGDGILEPLGPVVSPLSPGGTPALFFVHMRAGVPSGITQNIWSVTGDSGGYTDFTGDGFAFAASVLYEAATAA